MFSQRFQLPVVVTAHARERMAARSMDDALLLDIIDTGVEGTLALGIIGFTSTTRIATTIGYALPPWSTTCLL